MRKSFSWIDGVHDIEMLKAESIIVSLMMVSSVIYHWLGYVYPSQRSAS